MFNASMAIANSQMRADDFRRAGDQARLQGQIGAFGTLAGGFGSYSSIGSPDGMTISKGGKQIGNNGTNISTISISRPRAEPTEPPGRS